MFIKELKSYEDSRGNKHNHYADAAVMSIAYELSDTDLNKKPSDNVMGMAQRVFHKRQNLTIILNEIRDNLP